MPASILARQKSKLPVPQSLQFIQGQQGQKDDVFAAGRGQETPEVLSCPMRFCVKAFHQVWEAGLEYSLPTQR